MKNATKIFFAVALVLAGWSAGFFMGSGPGGEKGAAQSATNPRDGSGEKHGDSRAAAATGNPGGSTGNDANLTLPTPGSAGSLAFNKALVIDTTAPTAFGFTTGNAATAGRILVGDSFTLTYSEAINPGSVIGGWDGVSAQNVVVRGTDKAGTLSLHDELTIYNSTNVTLLPLGTLDLGASSYFAADRNWGFSVKTVLSTITMSTDHKSVTVTFGSQSATTTTFSR